METKASTTEIQRANQQESGAHATGTHPRRKPAVQQQRDEPHDDLRELDDPEFFRHWAALRQRIALGGNSVPCELKRRYKAVSIEYRRRINGEND